MLTFDEILDNLLLVQRIRVAEDMKCCRSPVESVDPEMLREPILEVVLFLELKIKKGYVSGFNESRSNSTRVMLQKPR